MSVKTLQDMGETGLYKKETRPNKPNKKGKSKKSTNHEYGLGDLLYSGKVFNMKCKKYNISIKQLWLRSWISMQINL